MTTTDEENSPIVEAIPDDIKDAENPNVDDEIPQKKEPGPFYLEVDPQQQYKAKELKICSFARPHMRAFHVSAVRLLSVDTTSIDCKFK